ncbi:hypothetical protein GGI42DRAFT_319493 [Trichoderma sp. SZMC 28013]
MVQLYSTLSSPLASGLQAVVSAFVSASRRRLAACSGVGQCKFLGSGLFVLQSFPTECPACPISLRYK